MNNASPCRVCGETDHTSTKCGNLRDVLKEGFFSGGGSSGGGGDHDHDDEDEKLAVTFNKNNELFCHVLGREIYILQPILFHTLLEEDLALITRL